MVLIKKKVAKSLTYARRFQALTAHDQVVNRTLQRAMAILALKIRILRRCKDYDKDRVAYLSKSLILLSAKFAHINYIQSNDIKPLKTVFYDERGNEIKDMNLERFDDRSCYATFGFRKPELRRMIDALHVPESVTFDTGNKLSGEEAFLRGLHELRTGLNQDYIARKTFGGDQPIQSRAFKWFIDHMYDNFKHLVQDNLEWFFKNGLVRKSAEAIRLKMNEKVDDIEFLENNVAFFID